MSNQIKQGIGISETLAIISKSKDFFSPVKESLMNALDAIKQRQDVNSDFIPNITLSLIFAKSFLWDECDGYELHKIIIKDNGIGFGDENIARLKHLGDRSKGLNNRGTGKIQIFHRFRTLKISSIHNSNGVCTKTEINYDLNDNYSESNIAIAENVENLTTVEMTDFYGDKNEKKQWLNFKHDSEALKKEIIKNLFLRLYLEKKSGITINIEIFCDDALIFDKKISGEDIPDPEQNETISVDTVKYDNGAWHTVRSNKLDVMRFKIPADKASGNAVYLCSKNILVKNFSFHLLQKKLKFNDFFYLTSVSGELLDDPTNVNQSVDDFTFPSRKKIESEIDSGDFFYADSEFEFAEDIKKSIGNGLNRIYSDIKELESEHFANIRSVAKTYGISADVVEAVGSAISINDSDDAIAMKLFAAQAKKLAKTSIEIQNTYKEVIELETKKQNPLNSNYPQKIYDATNKLLSLIPTQNRDELARYVIRRDMIVKILRLILCGESAAQCEWEKLKSEGKEVHASREGLIHDLIFKRKSSGSNNDLWILNEEFVHFSGYSDIPLNELKIKDKFIISPEVNISDLENNVGLKIGHRLKKRPDIFLYPEEGKCVLIEFKAPEEDMSLYLDQLPKYAKLLANFSQIKMTNFYCYLVGENINPLDVPDRYKKAHYGNYWFNANEPINNLQTFIPIADLYQEIIPLSTIADRAEARNRSFAEKLGLQTNASEVEK